MMRFLDDDTGDVWSRTNDVYLTPLGAASAPITELAVPVAAQPKPVQTVVVRPFAGDAETVVASDDPVKFYGDGAPSGCLCCGGSHRQGDGGPAQSAGLREGSQPGLSEVMTYTQDLVDGRYEYTSNQLIDAVLFGSRWTVTNITFSFPATAEFYETPYYEPGHLTNHIPFNAAQQTAARYAFSLVAGYTSVTFTEATESAETHGIIRLSQTDNDSALGSAEGNFPGSDASDGDIWFGSTNQPFYLTPAIGNWGQATMMHEIGHTLGLKHGQDNYTSLDLTNGGYLDGPGPHYGTAALPANKDGWAWSLMTYRSAPGFTASFQGDRYNQPQTYMQADIAALQFMYGANFTTHATDSIYTFSATTGEMFINGTGQGTPEINAATGIGKIFRTVWDGDGIDTYDLANFSDNQTIDLRPGQFSAFSQAQLGDSRPLVTGFTAQPGNIANALLYQGDVRSLIENAIAGVGNDTVIGNQAANALNGNDGNDVLDGGTGDDVMTGGAGDDTYGVDAAGDSVIEISGQGTDLVAATISYTLGDDVENLTLTGTGNIDGTGNSLGNRITGGAGSNVLNGLDGNDTLIGSYDYRTPAQTIDETTLTTHNTIATALALSGFGVNSDPDIADATTAPHVTVIGNGGGNTYDMYSFLVEAAGVVGTFDIDLTAVLDSFVELYDGSGTRLAYDDDAAVTEGAGGSYAANDSLLTYTFAAAGTYYLRVGRFATATTSAALQAGHSYVLQVSLTGNVLPPLLDGNDWLDGGAGSDVLEGGIGNDTYVVDSADDVVTEAAEAGIDTVRASLTWSLAGGEIEYLTLTGSGDFDATGNAKANSLTGNSGHNHLDGGDGADSLAGGGGNDTYVVDAGDAITENAGAGNDLIETAISHTLSANVENLTLTGTAAVNGTGNALGNVLTGNGGNNILTGGTGNDTYYVDSLSDRVVELHYEGTDLIYTTVSYSLFGRAVESVIMTGDGDLVVTGNSLANRITGNSGDNQLNGAGGNDTLIGGMGDDTYYVDNPSDWVEEWHYDGIDLIYTSASYSLFGRAIELVIMTGDGDLVVTGNSLANRITGNSGDNQLNGDGGDDTLIGGMGDDSYTVDSADDIVTESAGEGTDLVLAYTTYTLGAEIENLTMVGSIYWGQSGTGNALNNVLAGNSNHNILDGRAGDDTLVGGDGHDTYYVDSVGDKVVEANLQGTDEIEASVSYALQGTHVELLRLAGSEDLTATGNSIGNVLVGNSGNNVLNGKGGSDHLYGGSGSDVFMFESINGHEYIDDFTAAHADIVNLNGWTGGVPNTGAVTQSGADVLITFSDWNDIRVVNAVVDDVLAHIVW